MDNQKIEFALIESNRLESLEKLLQTLVQRLETIGAKRWLSTKELAVYISYSEDGVRKLKDTELFIDIHYFKRSGKIIYDRLAVDEWILQTKEI